MQGYDFPRLALHLLPHTRAGECGPLMVHPSLTTPGCVWYLSFVHKPHSGICECVLLRGEWGRREGVKYRHRCEMRICALTLALRECARDSLPRLSPPSNFPSLKCCWLVDVGGHFLCGVWVWAVEKWPSEPCRHEHTHKKKYPPLLSVCGVCLV